MSEEPRRAFGNEGVRNLLVDGLRKAKTAPPRRLPASDTLEPAAPQNGAPVSQNVQPASVVPSEPETSPVGSQRAPSGIYPVLEDLEGLPPEVMRELAWRYRRQLPRHLVPDRKPLDLSPPQKSRQKAAAPQNVVQNDLFS